MSVQKGSLVSILALVSLTNKLEPKLRRMDTCTRAGVLLTPLKSCMRSQIAVVQRATKIH